MPLSLQAHLASLQPQLSTVSVDPRGFKLALQSLIKFLIAHEISATLWLKLPKEDAWWTDIWQYGQKTTGCTIYSLGEQIGRPPDNLVGNVHPIPIEQNADLKREYLCLAIADNFVGALLATRIAPGPTPDKRTLRLYCSTAGRTVAALSIGIRAIIESSLSGAQIAVDSPDSWPATQPDSLPDSSIQSSSADGSSELGSSCSIVGRTVLSQWDRCFPANLLNQGALPLTEAFLSWQLQSQEDLRSQLAVHRNSARSNHGLHSLAPDFLSQASQELQSPLTTIKTALTLLGSPALKLAQRQRYLEMIAAQCDRQKTLITSVIGLLQIQTTAATSPNPLQLADVIPGIVSTYQPIAEERGIMLAYTVSPDLAKVLAVEPELKQVVIHLIKNGIQITPRGGQVWVAALPYDSSFVGLTVQDSGSGITKSDIARLFEAFYRGPTYGEGSLGAGLGLTLVQQLVKRMGGSVSVDSTPGQGTTFQVLLPIPRPASASGSSIGAADFTAAVSPSLALDADHHSASLVSGKHK